MALEIHLLGVPHVVRDGLALPGPRGHKVWGLLAYLLCSTTAPSRAHLAAQLFEDAEDPLAALRWNLTELRRLLGDVGLRGDTPGLLLPPGTVVDIQVLARSGVPQAIAIPGLGRELLEGMRFSATPAFSVWLDSQRRRHAALSEALLREAALGRLATGHAGEAADLAARLVQLNPLDEAYQALLVRSLAASGNGIAAARQVAACTDLFRKELGVSPGAVLAAAARTTTANAVSRHAGGRAATLAQIEAGSAAIRAGAHQAGLECLRRAVVESDALADLRLRVRARVELGSALVHAAKGSDEEGAVALHEALALAEPAALAGAATAARELAYIEFLRGRYERACVWLERATPLAAHDAAERAAIATLEGAVTSDTGHYDAAAASLSRAIELGQQAADARQVAYALSMLGRVHLLRGVFDDAAQVLDRSIAIAQSHWTAFLPWPQSLRAEVELETGEVASAAERFEDAFALGCQLGDPCWEGIARRGLGRVAAARGEYLRAADILSDAVRRCTRLPDAYLWGKAYALLAFSDLAVSQRLPDAEARVHELQEIASRSGMREMVVRSLLHQAALGRQGSAAAAAALCADIPSPVLRRAVSIAASGAA